jgi:hypothetical protein
LKRRQQVTLTLTNQYQKNMNTPTRNQILNLMIDMGAEADDADELLDWAVWEMRHIVDWCSAPEFDDWRYSVCTSAKHLWRNEFPMHKRFRWQSNEIRDLIMTLCEIEPDWDVYHYRPERCCMTIAKERAEMYL